MNLGKVKNFLIILFLGINIYLIISMYSSTRFPIDDATVKDCVALLDARGISLEADKVPDYTVNLNTIDTHNAAYSNDKIRSMGAVLSGNRFEFKVPKEDISRGEITARSIKKYFESLDFESKYMDISYSKTKEAWYIKCRAGDYAVFDSYMKLTLSGDGECTIEGRWYEPSTDKVHSRTRSRNTVYITSVLVDMSQNESIMKNAPFEITDIDYGYLAGELYGNASHVTSAAMPYYRIKDSLGNVYYFDAQSGTYLEN